ncbi:MAG: PQQ-dependent sugar dehydrogenase, partial [Rubrivivax sp.]
MRTARRGAGPEVRREPLGVLDLRGGGRGRQRRGGGPRSAPGAGAGRCPGHLPTAAQGGQLSLHCGSRLAFAKDGRLFVGLGDRFGRKDESQNPANHIGKIVRIEPDGRVPADNPLAGRSGAAPEVFSLGHRNIQGLAVHPVTGELWQTEHGPQGGDEINAPEAGRNYGWPIVTYGRNYGIGTRIGEEGPKPGFEQPLRHWVPQSIAPSGMAFVTSDRYPGWKGSLVMG